MLAQIYSGATLGLDGVKITVEVDIPDQGFPRFTIVGLPGKAIREAIERVRSAIKNAGQKFPNKRITVNLTPADLPKEGPAYDLPIAIGLLVADGKLPDSFGKSMVFGELSLDGSLRPVKGALPLTLLAKQEDLTQVFLPAANAKEAALISHINIFPVKNLKQLISHFQEEEFITPITTQKISSEKNRNNSQFDMRDVKGQEQAKRVMEIAAAGGHNVFMIGSPGSGKTMLARTLPTILPEMTEEEMLDVTKIFSISGKLTGKISAITTRPFRSPHHTTSMPGLVGGGSQPKPGEISLAHRGILFLDEFLEFPRIVLETLRQPMEDGVVTVSRAAGTLEFPAQFLLVAAANPCPCGYRLSKTKNCTCPQHVIDRYQKRISGPILDRIDLHVTVPEVEVDKLNEEYQGESSQDIQKRVNTARQIQVNRYNQLRVPIYSNSDMSTKQVKKFCTLDQPCKNLLRQAVQKMNLTARSYFRIIKVSRTIADLAGSENIQVNHIAEALQYRPRDIG